MTDWMPVLIFLVLVSIVGFFVLLYLYRNNKIRPLYTTLVKVILRVAQTGFLLLIAYTAATLLYRVTDAHQWFLHSRNVLVLEPHRWPVDDTSLCELDGDVNMPVLTCGDHDATPHKLTVHFRGPVPSHEMKTSWDCEKEQGAISCKPKIWNEYSRP